MGANDKRGGRCNQSKREDKQKRGSNERTRKRSKREDEQNHGANVERTNQKRNERTSDSMERTRRGADKATRANERTRKSEIE
jgi:hypothetical protein